ncbi:MULTISPECIES: alpha/beta hydrolase [unclassified Rhodococcus (in: high G+C Gram-positive bacteria)]|jgi:S-formylglutathione hydrolase FrmB|uniref:alpha/beta hydrolase n=1 Tax=unclassified Rhodococcus (in: high G+C Gram-positive bacteria) TaxID=192944 RepID=UPI0006F7CD73|nr:MULTISPECIES: alpha/beta hydrolase family protein [unclassified Rhodococcus (in: high G+C Gram-positive bacteria)]KQU36393.1 esterase [Rhodococcus sp. Leaf225]KQU48940.1 esterase [Rhodococcus sp. Leaf258]
MTTPRRRVRDAVRTGRLLVPIAIVTALLSGWLVAPVAAAAESTAPIAGVVGTSGARVESVDHVGGLRYLVTVYSPSMGRSVPLQVFRPADTSAPRPTYYLLNGASGGEDPSSNWPDQADVEPFFADKNVNVVIPVGGAYSYYTDWVADDPELGRNKWETFLTQELPPVIDASLGTTGTQAIGGISMAASAVLMLAADRPGFYSSVASFSGCAGTSDDLGRAWVTLVVEARGGGDTENMWGPAGGPEWIANDALLNAEKLRGTPLYLSTGNGLPGFDESLDSARIAGDVRALVNRVVVGGGIEAITDSCTRTFASRLAELGIPATVAFRDRGTHSWAYWQDDLHDSWPMVASSLGL